MNKKGYTFLEVLAVITVIGLTLPTLFTIVYSILRQQSKINALMKTRNEGDYALALIENLIKNSSVGVYSTSDVSDPTKQRCNNPVTSPRYPVSGGTEDGSNIYFKDKFSHWFQLYSNSGIISSDSSILNASSDLTTSKVVISNFKIYCETASTFSTPLISISFQVRYNTTSLRPEEVATFNYQTKIKIRNISN